MNQDDLIQLRLLVSESIEGIISQERMKLLNEILLRDRDARLYYLDYVNLRTIMKNLYANDINFELDEISLIRDSFDYDQTLQQLADEERNAPSIEIDIPELEPQNAINKVERVKVVRKINKPFFVASILSAAALFFFIVYLHIFQRYVPEQVATVIKSFDAEYVGNEYFSVNGRLIDRKQSYWLTKGVIEIEFDYGAKVVLEAPAEYRLESPEKMFLCSGRVYAKVPKSASGFIVDTPNSKIIDLGTEFGVKVDLDGASNIHMFKGKASLIPGQKGKTTTSSILMSGQARHISKTGQVKKIPVAEKAFIRAVNMDKKFLWRGEPLSLLSLMAGEDGFTKGEFLGGIDPLDGAVHKLAVQDFNRLGGEGFHPVSDIEYVDGVFVPNGANGDNIVSSAGHKCNVFPETSSAYWADITTAQDSRTSWNFLDKAMLDTESKSLKDQCFLLIHSNAGITFDLEKIRLSFPQVEISEFKAVCGLSPASAERTQAEFWVLIDGECEFHYKVNKTESETKYIEIPIKTEQRFLTLATTEGNDEIKYDWCVFANPRLELRIK